MTLTTGHYRVQNTQALASVLSSARAKGLPVPKLVAIEIQEPTWRDLPVDYKSDQM